MFGLDNINLASLTPFLAVAMGIVLLVLCLRLRRETRQRKWQRELAEENRLRKL